jgi:hypothetical protein
MNRLLSKLAAPALCTALAAGLFFQVRAYGLVDDPVPLHKGIQASVRELPVRFGRWEGLDVQPPPAAGQLLRPNALFTRHYQDPAAGRWANLIFIHCKDARDMSGHYPPNCYPGNGWTPIADERAGEARAGGRGEARGVRVFPFQIWGRSVPIAEYRFTRAELNRARSVVIYNFFVLPTGRFCTGMDEVRSATGDVRTRTLGCAQVQVVMDDGTPADERSAILREMLEPLGPTIHLLQSTRKGDSQ